MKKNILPWVLIASVNLMGVLNVMAAGTVSTGTDEDARLPYWEYADAGISVRLVQRLPDQSRGYFLARGFTLQQVETIAQSCVFQTIFRNVSNVPAPGQAAAHPSAVEYNLRDWKVIRRLPDAPGATDKISGLKTREDWARHWQSVQAPKSAQIAFEWSLFPTEQVYQPGDYNWGMTIFDLPPGTDFDLEISWKQHNRVQQYRIEGLQCAPDIHPETAP